MNQADRQKSFVEKAVAWGAVSYALGFLIIMLHTSRLGLPVLELLKPIYVWIGLPLSTVGFFSTQIFSWFRRRASTARDELLTALRVDPQAQQLSTPDLIDRLSTQVARLAPYLPRQVIVTWYRHQLRTAFNDAATDPHKEARLRKSLDRLLRVLVGTFAFTRLLSTASYAYLFGVALWLYVWVVYPHIPKAFGGGAPVTIQIVVKRASLPASVATLLRPPSAATRADGAATLLTDTLTLLYTTSDAMYLQTRGAKTLSLATSEITAVLWH